jgi:2-polyprenyl-3-methyl-5-hydroxy-6-metoxy-1,4-benzoquinol methylase
MVTAVRPRACLLHIAKCAGSSVGARLAEATGLPPPPDQQFDHCYLAGFEQPELLDPAVRATVAWDDRPTGVGDHVFLQHWSLPTILGHFDGTDVATVLREPSARILSYVEFTRSLPQALHRAWYPETLPAVLARSSLVDVLSSPRAARAIDNLIVRQVLWGDPRIPEAAFIAEVDVDALAADTITRLEQLAVVGVVEDMAGAWSALQQWLGTPLHPGHDNRTVPRQVPGLLRSLTEIDTVHRLLQQRSRADRIVWRHFAERWSVDIAAAERSIHQRLDSLAATAMLGRVGPAHVDEAPDRATELRAGLQAAIGDHRPAAAFVDVAPEDLPPLAGDALAATTAGCLSLRDLLAGHDLDVVVLAPVWADRLTPEVLDRLDEVLNDAGHAGGLVVCTPTGRLAETTDSLRQAGWVPARIYPAGVHTVVTARRPPQPAEVITPDADAAAEGMVTRYGYPIDLDSNDDSRAVVLRLAAGGHYVFELGCSEGLMTRVMHERGQQVFAVEFDPAAAAAAAPFTRAILVADLDDPQSFTPFAHLRFDTILAADVLEHLRDPEACLRRAVTMLAPGGRVVLSIPNATHVDVRLAVLDGDIPYSQIGLLDHTHIQWFGRSRVDALVRDAGLAVIEWHRIHRPMGATELPPRVGLDRLGRSICRADADAETYQWVVVCQRTADGAVAAAAPWDASAQRHVR